MPLLEYLKLVIQSPYNIVGKIDAPRGRVYGRGALDMKGGLYCAIFAVKAIMDAELDGRVLIESVIGEEDGGSGTLAAVVRGHQADAAVIMEPTELMITPAQAGCLTFVLLFRGRQHMGPCVLNVLIRWKSSF